MRDPKFGFHILWMVPAFYVVLCAEKISTSLKTRARKKRIQNLPDEQKRMLTLAGVIHNFED